MKKHKVITHGDFASGGDSDNPLNPTNGNLEKTLDDMAIDGWTLLSYDMASWRRAIFVKEVEA